MNLQQGTADSEIPGESAHIVPPAGKSGQNPEPMRTGQGGQNPEQLIPAALSHNKTLHMQRNVSRYSGDR
ncbi:hypothetical protein GCM10009828_072050 [Actinoplanes couchii]|uniref:Uncharacterized protein n=1 Tax=Actinoplanes couchii TaxID=403638 RepID=A0ABQ3X103_9ACTN|nr:hypothetical protein Aco03nite_004870 [Actinoplanes couchii]